MLEMLELPGVARKTANIVLQNAYGVVEGIAVDTHVRRVSARLGLTENHDPNKIEQDLMRIVPKEKWVRITDLLITLGRRVCTAKKPRCEICVLNQICPSAFTFN
jgi:endonuclease-3